MTKTVTRLFDNYDDAANAVSDLEALGVPHSDISIVANKSDKGHGRHNEDISDDAGKGAKAGAFIGGAGGLLAGLGVLAIPGLGPVVAAGWLISTAVGAGIGAAAGGATGGLIGALKEGGVDENDAHVYSEGVRRGGTLLSARVDDSKASEAEAVLTRHRAVDASTRGEAYRASGWKAFDENAPVYTSEEVERERELYSTPSNRL